MTTYSRVYAQIRLGMLAMLIVAVWLVAQGLPSARPVTAAPLDGDANPFSDVLPGDWYYPHVLELYSLGVVSGYQDGTFRPSATVTRGQFTKMLALAANLQIYAPATATFADVPTASAFFPFAETAAARGLATGYDCGARGEPCDVQHRRYFRPAVNVTRGQAAKMIALAFGLRPYLPRSPMFADVPSSSPFYGYINAIAGSNVIGGYSCGGPGESCINSLPYFRPNSSTTRAQASKLLDLSRWHWRRTPTPTPTDVEPTEIVPPASPTVEDETATDTATATDTTSPTSTPYASATDTETPSPTETLSPTDTPSQVPSLTETPLPASTGTFAPTDTPVAQPSSTWTFTATPTVSRTRTSSPTASHTATQPTPTWTRILGGSGTTANDPIPCALWPSDNIWNRRIDSLPTHIASGAYVNTIGADDYLSNGFASHMWQGFSIGNPYNVVPTAQPMVPITFTDYPEDSNPGPYPYPTHAIVGGASHLTPVPSSGDRHSSVLRAGSCILFETWHSQPQANGSWSAANGAMFNLRSNQLRPAGWTSADAAGFAILPGLLRYDEVASGQVTHAIRFTAPNSAIGDTYVWPARHTDGSATSQSAPPMGTRFRLKASVDVSSYPPRLRTILQGLKTYGMFLADGGDPWQIDGAPDQRWDDDELQLLHGIHGSDFEAVDESGLMIDPNSGQSR